MKKAEVKSLAHGLYEVHWKGDEGVSLAAVGSNHYGEKWLAPCNWTSAHKKFPRVASTRCWSRVESVKLIAVL